MVGGLQASEPLSIATTEGRAAELSEAAVALFFECWVLDPLEDAVVKRRLQRAAASATASAAAARWRPR
jgi:hypothetical protein